MVLVAWPVVFGVALTLVRVAVLAVFGVTPLRPADYAGLLLGLAGMIATGVALAVPLHFLRRTRARLAIYPIVVAVVFANVAAFHYEAVFSRLPGVNLLYYLRESASLSSSAARHAPAAAVIAEVAIASAILIAAAELLRRRETASRVLAIVCLASLAVTLVTYVKPSVVPRALTWRSRTPLLWAAQSWSVQRSYGSGPLKIEREEIFEFQRRIGHAVPFGGVDPRYPLCGSRGATGRPNGRSVIFLVLESVAADEMRQMPNLRRIAAEGVSFRDVKAGGTKSLQAMPALFAGVPPQPAAHLLWREPLNNLEGFPLILRGHGYRTAYFHGGDLSFEQQRPFLRMSGFEEIVELDPAEPIPLYGWGYPDEVVFRKMERWIESRRDAPYLATLFTLSTHDPYVIPNGKSGGNLRAAFSESLRYLDAQLGSFYEWYLRTELPRGTLLVITGDHAPHLSGERHIEDDQVTRFDVPLVIRGARLPRTDPARAAAHFDVPATILGLAGIPPGRCDQGLDLFAPAFPADRTRYAVAGDELEEFYYWTSKDAVHLDLVRGDGGTTAASSFYRLARSLSEYLVREDAFAPPPSTVRAARKPLGRVVRPLFAAHRGQSRGPLAPELQNGRAVFEQALADGFEWLELDVNLTRDEQLVVVHDAAVAGREVASMTLAELRALPGMAGVLTLPEVLDAFAPRAGLMIELKPQKTLGANSMLALRAALLVRTRTRPGHVVMDSYSPFLASSLEQHCRCAVGIDAPPRPLDSRWVDNAALTRMEWIYVDHRQASPELIRYAHQRGLRVLVFTVNDLAEIQRLEGEWPDAVITDRAELVRSFDARYARR